MLLLVVVPLTYTKENDIPYNYKFSLHFTSFVTKIPTVLKVVMTTGWYCTFWNFYFCCTQSTNITKFKLYFKCSHYYMFYFQITCKLKIQNILLKIQAGDQSKRKLNIFLALLADWNSALLQIETIDWAINVRPAQYL